MSEGNPTLETLLVWVGGRSGALTEAAAVNRAGETRRESAPEAEQRTLQQCRQEVGAQAPAMKEKAQKQKKGDPEGKKSARYVEKEEGARPVQTGKVSSEAGSEVRCEKSAQCQRAGAPLPRREMAAKGTAFGV